MMIEELLPFFFCQPFASPFFPAFLRAPDDSHDDLYDLHTNNIFLAHSSRREAV